MEASTSKPLQGHELTAMAMGGNRSRPSRNDHEASKGAVSSSSGGNDGRRFTRTLAPREARPLVPAEMAAAVFLAH
jgi:hypothetical protein